jgi:glutamate--cysteine ligase catalytic subunit
MGLLVGEKKETLNFAESRKYQHLLKKNASKQLARLLVKFEHFEKNPEEALKFGTELESHLLSRRTLDGKTYYPVCLDSKKYMNFVRDYFKSVSIQEEFSAWMVELLPEKPFGKFLSFHEIRKHFLDIDMIALNTQDNPVLISGLSVLPHIGTLHYHLTKENKPIKMEDRKLLNVYSGSEHFIDDTITDHSRFKTFTKNVPARRKTPLAIRMPIYQDINTKEKELVLDHFGFGMCNTALQITYSCKNLTDARLAHDLMHVISPFMLVFSSSIFALNGRLVDTDCRFDIIQQATDDRSPRELGKIEKGRYSLINYYLSNDARCKSMYNDKKYTINKTFQKWLWRELKNSGSKLSKDKRLLNHFAYLFVRDYLVMFPERIVEGFDADTLDFEAIQSSNWNNMRLKPPGSYDSPLGWLVEFRCMDSPITEREKTSLVFMTTLFFRIVNDDKLKVDFYVPISTVDKNFEEAFKRDAISKGKFAFRKHFCPLIDGYQQSDEVVQLSMKDFWAGNSEFAGMRKLFEVFIQVNSQRLAEDDLKTGANTIDTIWTIYEFFLARSKGTLMTAPQYLRSFVCAHPDYLQNSILSDKIVADIIEKILEIQTNNYQEEMFGVFKF